MCMGCAVKGLFGYGEDDDVPAILTPLMFVTTIGFMGVYSVGAAASFGRRRISKTNTKLFHATYKPFIEDKISKINVKIALRKVHSKESQSRYYVTRAKYYMLLEDKTNEAIDDLKTATTVFPANAEAYALLASLQMRLGKYDEAITSFTSAIGKLPQFKASKTLYRKAREMISAASDELDTQATIARDTVLKKLVPLTIISTTRPDQHEVNTTIHKNQLKAAYVKRALKYLDNETKDLLAKRAAAHFQAAEFSKAITDFTAAIQQPNIQKEMEVMYKVPLATSLLYERRFQESAAVIDSALADLPSCCTSFLNHETIKRKLYLMRNYIVKNTTDIEQGQTNTLLFSSTDSEFFPYRFIPQELLPMILSFLPHGALVNLAQTCRYMKGLAYNPDYYRFVNFDEVIRVAKLGGTVPPLLAQCYTVQFPVQKSYNFYYNSIDFVKQLRNAVIPSSVDFSVSYMLPNLTRMELVGYSISKLPLQGSFNSLEELVISRAAEDITDSNATVLSQKLTLLFFPKLQRLVFNQCNILDTVPALLKQLMPAYQTAILQNCFTISTGLVEQESITINV